MRAALLESLGTPLRVVDDVEIEEPRAGQVRVRVKHCGICHSDLSVVDGKFPVPTPVILGHEAAGVVDAARDVVALRLQHVRQVELERRLIAAHDEQVGVAMGVDAQYGADSISVLVVQIEVVFAGDPVVDPGLLDFEPRGVDQ